MYKRRGSRREEYGRNKPTDDYRPWNAAIVTRQPESSRSSREINQGGVTAADVLGSDAPPSHATWRYSNLVALGYVEHKKPTETHSEAQKGNVREDEMMDDAPREPSELGPYYGNQYVPPNRQLTAPRQDMLRQDALRQDMLRQDVVRQDSLRQVALRQDTPQDTPRIYKNDDSKQIAKDTSAKSNIAEVSFRLVGSGFRRTEALIVDINTSNSTDVASSYYPNSSSSSPASANSPSTPDDPLLSPLLELNEALMSQVKTVKSSKSSDLVKAKPDKGGWKENWAQGYADIW